MQYALRYVAATISSSNSPHVDPSSLQSVKQFAISRARLLTQLLFLVARCSYDYDGLRNTVSHPDLAESSEITSHLTATKSSLILLKSPGYIEVCRIEPALRKYTILSEIKR
jgi:hypothetical protein